MREIVSWCTSVTRRTRGDSALRLPPLAWLVVLGIMIVPATAHADPPPLVNTPLAFGSAALIDQQAPFAHGWYINSLSCPTTTLCVGMDSQGNLLTTTDPTAPPTGWDRFSIGTSGESNVACPTASLCVALGDDGGAPSVVTSTDPTGGPTAWHTSDLPREWSAPEFLTCPTANFCAALTGSDTILTTDDPAGGAGTWVASTYTTGSEGGGSLTCASSSMCLIGTSQGTLFSSTDPQGGPDAWSAAQVQTPIGHLSCPTVHLCVGVGFYGIGLEVSINPTGGSGAWTETDLDSDVGSHGSPQVTCTASAFCMVFAPDGSVATTGDPEGGASAWSTVSQEPVPPGDGYTWTAPAACPEDQWCVAPTGLGDIAVSTDPAGPTGSWPSHSVDGDNVLAGVSCTSDADCVAVDDAGDVLTSTQPELAQPWAAARIDAQPLTGVSCIAGGPCVAVDKAGDVLTSSDPSGGAAAWSTSDVDPGNDILAVSCASGPVCMAVDNAGDLLLSTDPTGGPSAWQVANLFTPGGPGSFTGVSCADATLCVASGPYWLEVVENPGRDDAVWKEVQPGNATVESNQLPFYTSVTCPSSSFCATTVLTSSGMASDDPTGNGLAWTAAPIPSQGFNGSVVCQSPTLCLYVGLDNVIYEATNPTSADGDAWAQATPDSEDGADDLTGASCPTAQFCIVVGNLGDAWSGEGSGYVPPPPAPGGSGGGGTTGSSPTAPLSPAPPTAPPSPAPPTAPPSPSPLTTPPSSGSPAPFTPASTSTPARPAVAPESDAGGTPSATASRSLTAGSARLRLQTYSLTRARHIGVVRITCASRSAGCAGTISLTTRERPGHARSGHEAVLWRVRYEVHAGRTATVSLALSPRSAAAVRRLRARRLAVEAVVRPVGGRSVSSRLVLS